jgi:putative Holliday junction resolvase
MEMSQNIGRIIALDIGTVRIGVAVSDPTGAFAQGVSVLKAEGDWSGELETIIEKYAAKKIVVGMPRRTDGNDGPEASKMERAAGRLRLRFPNIEISTWDERFTTVIANRTMLEGGASRAARRGSVDKVAAAVLLQNYLDALNGPPVASVHADAPFPSARKSGRGRCGGRKKSS